MKLKLIVNRELVVHFNGFDWTFSGARDRFKSNYRLWDDQKQKSFISQISFRDVLFIESNKFTNYALTNIWKQICFWSNNLCLKQLFHHFIMHVKVLIVQFTVLCFWCILRATFDGNSFLEAYSATLIWLVWFGREGWCNDR